MTRRVRAWAWVWGPVGLALAVAGLPRVPTITTLVAIALASLAALATVTADHRGALLPLDWRTAIPRAVLATAGLLAVVGTVAVLPPALALAALLLAGLSFPGVLAGLGRRVRAVSPRLMRDDELGRAWRESSGQVRATGSRGRLYLARRRAGYLAEMERRNPAAVEAWLASEVWGEDGLERFVLPPRREEGREAA